MRKNLQRILTSLVLCAMLAGSLTAPASAAAFQDVPAGHWAADSIQRCVEKGFFNGQSETRFGLGQKMSRSAFAVVLCRFFGWETTAPTTQTYPDVPMDVWYAGAVEAAYEHGAITRQSDVFRPNDPITREELAVMLVRALGYGDIAGLAQDLPMPFEDVTTNGGYITMAYDLGLVSGTTVTTFSPDSTASREQVAVILMRLYDKIRSELPEKIGVVSAESDMTGLDIAAIPAVRAFTFGMKDSMEAETASAIRAAAAEAGAKVFLYMTAGATVLGEKPEEMSVMMADAVKTGGYEGLILNVPDVTEKKASNLNALAAQLDRALGEIPFYLQVNAPSCSGKTVSGYDYQTLSASADRLILSITAEETVADDFVVAPVDPLEEIHYAVSSVKAEVGVDKLSLMLNTEMDCWTKGGRSGLSEEGLAALLAAETTQVYHSDRYESAYLIGADAQGKPVTVWYLTEENVEERVQLAKCLGVKQICLSDWDEATKAFLAGLN